MISKFEMYLSLKLGPGSDWCICEIGRNVKIGDGSNISQVFI